MNLAFSSLPVHTFWENHVFVVLLCFPLICWFFISAATNSCLFLHNFGLTMFKSSATSKQLCFLPSFLLKIYCTSILLFPPGERDHHFVFCWKSSTMYFSAETKWHLHALYKKKGVHFCFSRNERCYSFLFGLVALKWKCFHTLHLLKKFACSIV